MTPATGRRLSRPLAVVAIALLFFAVPASAQTITTSGGGPVSNTSTRWEIEGYGAWAFGSLAAFGTSALPPQGAAILTTSVLFPSRQVPSWFFGDGAALFNEAGAEFALAERIASLDSAIGTTGLGRAGGGGVRLRRRLTPRVSLEFGVDLSTPRGISGRLSDAVEAARASFTPAFTALLGSGPFTNVVVSATVNRLNGSGLETATTAALSFDFRSRFGVVPYATLGGGVMTARGRLPAILLVGEYRFSVLSDVPISERDLIEVTFTRDSDAAPMAVLGGGIRRDVSDRWGWRVDGRLLVGGPATRLLIDARPAATAGSPTGFVESLTNPNIQFSNSASTGRQSTLGGPLDDFVAFNERVRTRVLLSIGIFRRF